jgi:Ca-activated chloride channel family protein
VVADVDVMRKIAARWPLVVAGIALAWSLFAAEDLASWLATREQRAYRAFGRGDFLAAVELARDPYLRGVARLRAGEFESAAAEFGRRDDARSALGRGNALVMLGRYDDAVGAYERALELRPGFEPAEINLVVARTRAERLSREGGAGTEGKLEADEIRFEPGKANDQAQQTEVVQGGEPGDESELRALWLRRMRTEPADFLRARFAWQLADGKAEKR